MWTYHEGLGAATYYTPNSRWVGEHAGEDYYITPCAAIIGGALHLGHALVAISCTGACCPMPVATWFGSGEPSWVDDTLRNNFPYFAEEALEQVGRFVREVYQGV